MEWVRTWVVITVSDGPDGRKETIARTAAELRALLAAARADPGVWHISHKPQRQLVGDKPTHCGCGQPYRTAGTLATPHDWLPCPCGGHWWWSCRRCAAETIDPPAAYDCRPRRPSRWH